MEKKNFVEYLVDKLGLEKDRELFKRTFENLDFDDSEFDFGETNNNEHYAHIRVMAKLDDGEAFDDNLVINIGKDPQFHETLIKLGFTYNGRLLILSVGADENESRLKEKNDILACDGALFGENSTSFINSNFINNNSEREERRFDLMPFDSHIVEPMRTQMCDYDRKNEKNIISSALKSVKYMDDDFKRRSTSSQMIKS